MTTNPPSLAELIQALPAGIDASPEETPANAEIQRMLLELSQKPIPTGRISRAWSLGTLQAKIAAAYLAWWLRSGFQDAETRRRRLDETHVAAAIQTLGRMSYLRGGVMKLGQVLAHWPDVLPTSFAEVLSRLHSEAPPMHFALLREHVRNELGADPTEVFDDFETEAFAAASLGQVHRARLRGTNRQVAVKIQYPDIARTIREDMKSLRAAAFGMRFSGDWENLQEQYDGIQEMLEQESDYEREAELQEAARRCLRGVEGVVVPRVIPELSTPRVLTMEYLDGLHLQPFLATNPSQELRNQHAERIFRSGLRLWYRERLVYADPHPGNFLFLPDGQLGLIDFGCCHRFTDEEFAYVMETERAALEGDEEALIAVTARGCDLEPKDLSPKRMELMHEYIDWCWEPILADGAYDFSDPEQFRRGARIYGQFIKQRWVRSLPVNMWIVKSFYGERAMLTHLKACIEYGRIVREESIL